MGFNLKNNDLNEESEPILETKKDENKKYTVVEFKNLLKKKEIKGYSKLKKNKN